jgi:hypothetical protein
VILPLLPPAIGSDRADIAVAEGECLHNRTGGIPIPAMELADMPRTPRQELVAPEDIAAAIALCCYYELYRRNDWRGVCDRIRRTTTCIVIYVIVGQFLAAAWACKRRSKDPSLKWPGCPVAPE